MVNALLKTSTYPLEVLDLSCLFYRFNILESLLSLNMAERLFLTLPKHRKEKKEKKEKKKREKSGKSGREKYLLLTEFEVLTVSYGPGFFHLQFMAQARSARAINRRGQKNVDP